jgi:hypothetical protein
MVENLSDLGWTRLLPRAETPVTNEQWSAIAGPDLPADARPYIARAITLYTIVNNAHAASATPADTRRLTGLGAEQAKSLAHVLEKISSNPRAIVGLRLASGEQSRSPPVQPVSAEGLRNAVATLNDLSTWLASGSRKIAGGRAGAHERSLIINLFVSTLRDIYFHFTGRDFSRATKGKHTPRDFVCAVFKIADPSVRPAQIEEALKRQVKARGEIRSRKQS